MPKKQSHRVRYRPNGPVDPEWNPYVCEHCGTEYAGYDESRAAAREQCPEAPEVWSSWRINERFLSGLYASFGDREITNREAYKYYARHHAAVRWHGGRSNWRDVMLQMNVRNTLCKAAYKGRLVRLGPGRYKFPEAPVLAA